MSKEQTLQTYNNEAAGLAEKFKNIGPRAKDVERGFSYINKDNPAVLEIGCGNGRDAEEILKRTSNFTGLDYSEGMLALAKQKLPQANFVLADIEEYEFEGKFDIIFSFASFLHSNKEMVAKILSKCHESLNPGGIIYISLKERPAYEELTKTDEFGTRTFYFYNIELIKELAGPKFVTVYTDHQHLLGQDWFTIILQKPNTQQHV